MKRLRPWARLDRWKSRCMRIVAGSAILARYGAEVPIPMTAGSPVNTCLPIPISGAVATAAEHRALRQFESLSVPRLDHVQRLSLMTIETMIVAVVPPVLNHQIVMLLRQDDDVVRVKVDFHRFTLLVAGVATEARRVAASANKLGRRHPDCRCIRYRHVHQRQNDQRLRPSP